LDRDKKIEDLKILHTDKEKEIDNLKKLIKNKEKEIDDLKMELIQKSNEIKHVRDGLEISIQDQDKLIKKLKANLTQKENDLRELSKQVNIFKEQSSNAKVSVKLVKKIDNVLMLKGFVTDKEFTQLKNKSKEEEEVIHY